MRPDHGAAEFPTPAATSAFRPCPAVSLRPPSAAPFSAVSSSREPCASSRVLRPVSCPLLSRKNLAAPSEANERLPSSFFPHRGLGQRRPLFARIPLRASFPPRRFARPRGLPPPPASRACFIPLPRPGFALQGFVPHRGAVPGFPGPFMPSCRWAMRTCGLTRASVHRSRLQGLAPRAECGVNQAG